MTIEEFNALPEEARRFIQSNAGCLSCGNKERKLTAAYELYKKSKLMSAYRLRGGGVNYATKDGKETGVLYNIKDGDDNETIRQKIKIAKLIHESNPELFISYDKNEISEVLKGLGKAPVIKIDTDKKEEPVKEQDKKEEPVKEQDKKEEDTL